MFGLGGPELLIIFVIVLTLFGSSRIPKLARSFGEAKRELNAGLDAEPSEPAKK
jgi:sec-independent protein translocase protein TatA